VLPARHRLRSSVDFAAVTRAGRGSGGARTGSRLIVVQVRRVDARAGLPARVGLVVSKAVGGAVVRNRIKRVLRALLRARIGQVPTGTDVVVRASPAAAGAPSAELATDLDRLLPAAIRRAAAQTAPR